MKYAHTMRILISGIAAALLAACQTASAPEPSRSFSWVCPDGARFGVRFPSEDSAILSHNGHLYTLSPAMSASGARYQGQGFEYWEHQGEARFTDPSGVHESCRAH